MTGSFFVEPPRGLQRYRTAAAIAAGRLASRVLRLLGRGATAMPGKLALTLAPGLLTRLTHRRRVFLVTGTNGKTTTVRMLCTILQEQGHTVITNPSGANLDSGLTTTLLDHLDQLRIAPADSPADEHPLSLVFEIDEAFFGKLAAQIQPAISVVTNFFRDQLDRFGELQHTRDLIARGLAESRTTAVLCADDSLCASLGRDRDEPTFFFGMEPSSMLDQSDDAIVEAPFCAFCGARYQYSGRVYGHLGMFSCPTCGFVRPQPDLTVGPDRLTEQGMTVTMRMDGTSSQVDIPVPGLHNAYNAAAAVMAAVAAGLPSGQSTAALSHVVPAFGRMERFAIGDKHVCLILVKNPVGMKRALDFVAGARDTGGMMLLLNANDPDGRDVSWIWDVPFEQHPWPDRVGVSGIRCDDMALRLYYAGCAPGSLRVSPDHLALFDQLLSECPSGRCIYILPNYTAMLALRADLGRRYPLRDFWR